MAARRAIPAGLVRGLLAGLAVIFMAAAGLVGASATLRFAGAAGSSWLLFLAALWTGLRPFRDRRGGLLTPSQGLAAALAAGLAAGLLVWSFAALAQRVEMRFVLDSITAPVVERLLLDTRPSAGLPKLLGLFAGAALLGHLTGQGLQRRPRALRAEAAGTRLGAGLDPEQRERLRRAGMVLLLLLAVLLPLRIGPYWNQVLGSIGIFILMGLGLNVVVGFAGLLDLGYVAFFAVGAYSYAFLNSPKAGLEVSFWLAVWVCVLLAAITGVLLGIPVLRMRGDYLAIVTLGFGEIIRLLANNLYGVTGGPQGILQIRQPVIPLLEKTLLVPIHFYYLILLCVVVVAALTDRLDNSRIGRAWVAMREDEDVAQAMGIDTVRAKLWAFAIGAAFAGLGGAIFAARQRSIFPADFTLLVSINVLCLIIIGGMGSIPGVIAGSLVLIGLPEVLRQFQDFRLMFFGALLVIMMVVKPEGFIPSRRRSLEIHAAEEEHPGWVPRRAGAGPGPGPVGR